jgi:hypothetical protein
MPLDPRIPMSGQAVPFNDPFKQLADVQDRRAQQQAQQEQSALRGQAFQQNAQQLQAGQVEADELEQYKAVIGNPDLTPESLLEEIRVKAPGKFEAARGRYEAHQQNILQTKQLKQQLQASTKAWIGGHLEDIAQSNYSPVVAEATLKMIEAEEPDFKPQADQIRQSLLEGGTPALKAIVDGMRPKAPTKEGFTLGEGQQRFDASGTVLASGPAKPVVEPKAPDLDAQLAAAIAAKDGPETKRLLNMKGQINAAGRAPAGEGGKLWVMRDGKATRISEGEYRPGDLPASTREQGRSVTSGDAGDLANYQTALDELQILRKELTTTKGSTGFTAQMTAAVPYLPSAAKNRQATIDRVKQVIGKALEGGVLRKEDEAKYEKILPTIKDPDSTVVSKLNGLEKAIGQRNTRKLEALADANYDTSKFTKRTDEAKPDAAAKAAELLKKYGGG